jgi:hypothetical protein
MRFLDKLRAHFSPQRGSSRLDVAVRCNRCGEVVRTQIDLHNDLSVQYGQGSTRHYWRKGLAGSGQNRCFQQIIVEYSFDADRRVIERRAEGGSFVD